MLLHIVVDGEGSLLSNFEPHLVVRSRKCRPTPPLCMSVSILPIRNSHRHMMT